MKVIIPIYRFQFNLLYKFGSYSFPSSWFIPIISNDDQGFPVINRIDFFTKMPPFEYEEEIVIIETEIAAQNSVELDTDSISLALSRKHILSQSFFYELLEIFMPFIKTDFSSSIIEILIENVKAVYPLTDNAGKKLKSRLESKIFLQPPVFEHYIHDYQKDAELNDHERGIKYLIRIFELSDTQVMIPESDIEKAYHYRCEGLKPIKGDSFWTYLVAYDRHRPFPKSNIGYVYDLAELVAFSVSDSKKGFEKGPLYQYLESRINDLSKLNFEAVIDVFDKHNEFSKLRDENIQTNVSDFKKYVTALIFLKAKDEINKFDSILAAPIFNEINELKDLYPIEVANSIYLLGYLFSGDKFFVDYYNYVKLPIFSNAYEKKADMSSGNKGAEYPVPEKITRSSEPLIKTDRPVEIQGDTFNLSNIESNIQPDVSDKEQFEPEISSNELNIEADQSLPQEIDANNIQMNEEVQNEIQDKIDEINNIETSHRMGQDGTEILENEIESNNIDVDNQAISVLDNFLIPDRIHDELIAFLERKSLEAKQQKIVFEIIRDINENKLPESSIIPLNNLLSKFQYLLSERKVSKSTKLFKSMNDIVEHILYLIDNQKD